MPNAVFRLVQQRNGRGRLRQWLVVFNSWWTLLYGATARKSMVALVDQLVVSGTRFLTTVALGRLAGMTELGVYSLGTTVVFLAIAVHQSLISDPFTVFVSRSSPAGRQRYTFSLLVQSLAISLVTVAALLGLGLLLSAGVVGSELSRVVWLLGLLIPCYLLHDLVRRHAFAYLNMRLALVLDSAVSGCQLAGLMLLFALGWLTAATTFASAALGCLAAVTLWWYVTPIDWNWRPRRVARDALRHWQFGRWVVAAQTIDILSWNAVAWLAALWWGANQAGLLAACMTVVLFANPFLLAIKNVLAPRAARAVREGGTAELRRVVWKTTRLIAIGLLGFCLLVAVGGAWLLSLLYGPQYQGYATISLLLAVALLLANLADGSDQGLWVLERPDLSSAASLLGLAVTFTLAPALMPAFGLHGAAGALIASSATASLAKCTMFQFLTAARQPSPEGAA